MGLSHNGTMDSFVTKIPRKKRKRSEAEDEIDTREMDSEDKRNPTKRRRPDHSLSESEPEVTAGNSQPNSSDLESDKRSIPAKKHPSKYKEETEYVMYSQEIDFDDKLYPVKNKHSDHSLSGKVEPEVTKKSEASGSDSESSKSIISVRKRPNKERNKSETKEVYSQEIDFDEKENPVKSKRRNSESSEPESEKSYESSQCNKSDSDAGNSVVHNPDRTIQEISMIDKNKTFTNVINGFETSTPLPKIEQLPQSKNFDEDLFFEEDLSDSDEIWLGQVPKSLNLDNLASIKVELGGTSSFKASKFDGEEMAFKVITTGTPSSEQRSILCVLPSKGPSDYQLRPFKPVGSVTVEEEIVIPNSVTVVHAPARSCLVMPNDLKTRHPLLGLNYKKQPKTPSEYVGASYLQVEKTRKNRKEKKRKTRDSENPNSSVDMSSCTVKESNESARERKKKNKRKKSKEYGESCIERVEENDGEGENCQKNEEAARNFLIAFGSHFENMNSSSVNDSRKEKKKKKKKSKDKTKSSNSDVET